jgi:hypothetical protein
MSSLKKHVSVSVPESAFVPDLVVLQAAITLRLAILLDLYAVSCHTTR